MANSQPTIKQMLTAIQHTIDALNADDDPIRRAKVAIELTNIARTAQEQFAEERSSALVELRDAGWSLGDMKVEFGLARARLSQIVNRDTYRDSRKERGKT